MLLLMQTIPLLELKQIPGSGICPLASRLLMPSPLLHNPSYQSLSNIQFLRSIESSGERLSSQKPTLPDWFFDLRPMSKPE